MEMMFPFLEPFFYGAGIFFAVYLAFSAFFELMAQMISMLGISDG